MLAQTWMSHAWTVVFLCSLNDCVFPLLYFFFKESVSAAREKKPYMAVDRSQCTETQRSKCTKLSCSRTESCETITGQHCEFNEPHFEE